MIVRNLSIWSLDEDGAVRRNSPRPHELRQGDYDQKFDSTTLLYDVFSSYDGSQVIAVAPPFLNLGAEMRKMKVWANETDVVFKLSEFDRYGEARFDVKGEVEELFIESEISTVRLGINRNFSSIFRDKRVIVTVSKNNDLTWISDWIRFNVRIHKADAVLIYDNGSTAYDLYTLEKAASATGAISVIVSWPFRWGPSGVENVWDSNFSQIGAWQHARHRFLEKARSVLNTDIDELVICPGESSIFEIVESCSTGYIAFPGRWIENINLAPDFDWGRRRHADFSVVVKSGRYDCPRKWAVIPGRCPEGTVWGPHGISGMSEDPGKEIALSYRHFRGINNSWKYDRNSLDKFDVTQHEWDGELARALKRASLFPTR